MVVLVIGGGGREHALCYAARVFCKHEICNMPHLKDTFTAINRCGSLLQIAGVLVLMLLQEFEEIPQLSPEVFTANPDLSWLVVGHTPDSTPTPDALDLASIACDFCHFSIRLKLASSLVLPTWTDT